MSAITPVSNRWSRLACVFFGSYALLGGMISFTGWVFDITRLTDWYKNGISIQPNTCIAVMAAGSALIAFAFQYRRIAASLGVLVALIGGTVLFQFLSGINLGVFFRTSQSLSIWTSWQSLFKAFPPRCEAEPLNDGLKLAHIEH